MRFLISLIVLGAGSLVADPVLSFNPATSSTASNYNQTVGWEFDVLTPITITGLGWYDQGLNGLGFSHMVGIWDSSGDLVISALVASGTTDPLDGDFRTVTIAPLVLEPGDYTIGGQNFANSTDQVAFNTPPTTESGVDFLTGEYSSGSGFVDPTDPTGTKDCCWGPSFTTGSTGGGPVTTPEPTGASALLALGILGAALARKRARKLGSKA